MARRGCVGEKGGGEHRGLGPGNLPEEGQPRDWGGAGHRGGPLEDPQGGSGAEVPGGGAGSPAPRGRRSRRLGNSPPARPAWPPGPPALPRHRTSSDWAGPPPEVEEEPVARRARSHRGLGSGHSGSGPGRPPGRRPARSTRAPPPLRWASPTRMTSPRRASPLSQDLLGAEAGAGGLSSAWEGPGLCRGHRAQGRGRGYSEAGVRGYSEASLRGSTQASPRAAGPPARGLGGCPPDPSPSGGGRGPCAPRSSYRGGGDSRRLRAGLLPAPGAARHPPASTHRPGSGTSARRGAAGPGLR